MAIPLLVETHGHHLAVVGWFEGRPAALAGHAVAETYSVLTRLPGDLRLAPLDAARLMAAAFESPMVLSPASASQLPERLGALEIAGAAVYDALIALAAVEHDAALATRDARARETYERVGATVVVVA